jgi:PAS domain S-box-containing protein
MKKDITYNDPELLRIQQELEIHQIELEMQNDELRAAQTEIEAGLRRYTDLFDFAPVGYLNLTAAGVIQLVNLTGASLIGKARALLTGRHFEQLVDGADRRIFREFLSRVFLEDGRQTCEVALAHPDRPTLHVRLEATRPDGELECRAVMSDVTERKRSEEALRESDRFNRSTLDSLNAHVAVIDAGGTILATNLAWREFAEENHGDRRALAEGSNYLAGCEKAFADGSVDAGRTARGIRDVTAGVRETSSHEYFTDTPAGPQWYNCHIRRFPDSGVIRVVVAHENISQIKQALLAEQAGAERITEQAALIDEARDAIITHDLDNRITFWSKGAERIYGWPLEQAQGKPLDELLHVDAQSWTVAEQAVRETGGWNGELRKTARNGKLLDIDERWTLLRDDQGRPKAILTIGTDITARKLMEMQFLRAQRLESIGTLVGGIAHNLNNVFAPIVMSIDLLKMRSADPKDRDLLAILGASAHRGAEMVNQVLSFARGAAGRHVKIQIHPLIAEIEKIANETFLKSIRVRTRAPAGLWAVMGDPTRLHQVLLNLCVNARDAMPGGGELTISASNVILDASAAELDLDLRPGPHVCLRIHDCGEGIPPEIIGRIFDPFFTTKDTGKGTGLGLSTSLAIVTGLGGSLRVASDPGTGTQFTIHLPAVTGESDAGGAGKTSLPHGGGELILVVDDEPSIREITRLTLEAHNYRVVLASDGAEAVAIHTTRGQEIAVVLTDMMMPEMDGLTAIRILRGMDPGVRIIAASGCAADGGGTKLASLGVTHFLPKPYTADSLLVALGGILNSG